MITFLIGFLTTILVLVSLFLMLLVLVQLPKKEAGSGLAFGGGMVDTVIGAGSGNVLTKLTKWSATIFFALALLISLINRHTSTGGSELQRNLEKPVASQSGPITSVPPAPAAKPATTPTNAENPINLTLPSKPATATNGTNATPK